MCIGTSSATIQLISINTFPGVLPYYFDKWLGVLIMVKFLLIPWKIRSGVISSWFFSEGEVRPLHEANQLIVPRKIRNLLTDLDIYINTDFRFRDSNHVN
jgi:hypothetical protein